MIVLAAMRAHADECAVPLGAACIASAIKARPEFSGVAEVRIEQFEPGTSPEAMARALAAAAPAAVGFSMYCWNRRAFEAAAGILRRDIPSLIIFAGGPDAAAPDIDLGLFDAVFEGEGEETVPEWLASALAAGAASGGTAAQARGRIRCRAPDAASLPSPWLDGTLDPASCDSITWELTRGCPFACAYCYEGRGSRNLRRIPESRIAAELARIAKSGVERVFVLDPTFNVDKARALSLLRMIAKTAPGPHWHFEARAELLDAAQAKAFAGLGCSLQIGLQSAHREVLARVNRDLDRKDFARKLALLDEQGVAYGLDLIYGLPGDSLAGFRESLDFALSLGPNNLDIFPLAILPGTEVAERAPEWGYEHSADPPYTVRSQPGFGAADMEAAAALARACDVFYSRGRAVPWFGSVASALKERPSGLLAKFAEWAASRGGDAALGDLLGAPHARIEEAQIAFVGAMLRERRMEKRLASAEDLIRFNGALSRALAEGEKTVLELRYALEDVEGPVILDLANFHAWAEPCSERVIVEPGPEGPEARSVRRR